ncbi:SGNH/GDSL hydrolase family protein [bacterium]|nr:SGNH/GDSL hydrolase family protein [bacterium]
MRRRKAGAYRESAAVAVLLAFALIEGAARVVAARPGLDPRAIIEENTRVPFEAFEERENTLGLRAAEMYELLGRPGKRVLCIGDSTTWGFGLDPGKAWPARLEAILNERSADSVLVLNAGRPGWATHSARAEIVEQRGLIERFEPEIVVIGLGWNDISFVREGVEMTAFRVWRHRARSLMIDRIRFLTFFEAATQEWHDARHRARYERYPVIPDHPDVEGYAEGLTEFIRAVRARSPARILVLGQPAAPGKIGLFVRNFQSNEAMESFYLHKSIIARARTIAADEGAAFADLAPVLEAAGGDDLFLELMHPNAAGYEVWARHLAERFVAEGWAP